MGWVLLKKQHSIIDKVVLHKKFRRKGNKDPFILVYIPFLMRNKIKNFSKFKWVNVWVDKPKFLFQFSEKQTSIHSRKVKRSSFVLPWKIVKDYWDSNNNTMYVKGEINKNDIIIDLRDMKPNG